MNQRIHLAAIIALLAIGIFLLVDASRAPTEGECADRCMVEAPGRMLDSAVVDGACSCWSEPTWTDPTVPPEPDEETPTWP
jgi:hypothetical protein